MSREQMLNRMNELLSAAMNENRAMTAEELAEYDNLKRTVDALDAAAQAAATGHANRSQDDDDDESGEGGEGEDAGRAAGEMAQRAIESERTRIRSIEDMCRHFGIESREFVDRGLSVDATRLPSWIS